MARTNLIFSEQDHDRFLEVLARLRDEASSKFVFLIDRSGQQIASSGQVEELDTTSLASLAAGNVAATEGLAQLIGEHEFTTMFHEGAKDSVHITLISDLIILLVIFDERSSLGLVRLRVKQHLEKLAELVSSILDRSDAEPATAGLAAASIGEITDEDIDALFG
jgi:predicted regulator of Ras-like GTPase activity (Roadblock/LC7/MglB family)